MPIKNNDGFLKRIWSKVLELFKLTDKPMVKVYNGYGNHEHCIVFGHVLGLSPLPRKRYRHNVFINAISLLRLFMVKPLAGVPVKMEWEGVLYEAKTETDGFFKFEWEPVTGLEAGWHAVTVSLSDGSVAGKGQLFIPHRNQYAFISDIDDTFLISHSSKLKKRLLLLLTKNAHSRKPFEGVVNHYQLLSVAHAPKDTTNPFFYVSSSEWNLYNYIDAFSLNNGLPAGIFLLSQIKKLRHVFKTGQGKHATKFMRIARVLEVYPEQRFVLLGDDTQEDPDIYASVCSHFKDRVFAVYIRHVEERNKSTVTGKIKAIEMTGVHCCYFTHSSEAVLHSKAIGLII